MKIVGRLLILLVGALTAAGMTVAGCGTTNNINSGGGTSGQGESCTRTFDCKTNLICEQNVCLPGPSMTTPDGGVVMMTTGDAGTMTMTGPHLGQLNESCQTTLDCQSPFECIGMRCSVVNYGLTATGKSCAECTAPADCCELPVGFNPGFLEYQTPVDGGFSVLHELNSAYVRCQDLLTFIGGDATICSGAASFPPAEEESRDGVLRLQHLLRLVRGERPVELQRRELRLLRPLHRDGNHLGRVRGRMSQPDASRARTEHGLQLARRRGDRQLHRRLRGRLGLRREGPLGHQPCVQHRRWRERQLQLLPAVLLLHVHP